MSDDPVTVGLPAPVERPLRLGPFPSARAALRFVGIASVGILAALVAGPVAWLPFLGGGFLLTAYRHGGKTLDERLGDLVRWELRRHGRIPPRRAPARLPARSRIARIVGSRRVAVLTAGGVPVAFLPPADAHALFRAYEEVLRSLDPGAFLCVGSEPLRDEAFRPPASSAGSGPEHDARGGYDEMVRLLCRRRRHRRVDLVLWSEAPGRAGRTALEARVESVEERLRSLGLDPGRAEGTSLARTLTRIGWSVEGLE